MASRLSRQSALTIMPMLCVGMPFVALCVKNLQCRTMSCRACMRPPYVLFDHGGADDANCDVSDG
ncbi:hypothetical protein CCL08_21240 [Pseudomonas congelans]|nr:hypothetical protein CCL08_21240 [Pseudomonas congelans]